MTKVIFKAVVRKVGNTAAITIPKEYIGSEVLFGEYYYFTIDKAVDNECSNESGPQ